MLQFIMFKPIISRFVFINRNPDKLVGLKLIAFSIIADDEYFFFFIYDNSRLKRGMVCPLRLKIGKMTS